VLSLLTTITAVQREYEQDKGLVESLEMVGIETHSRL
jgi:hypothetical protein